MELKRFFGEILRIKAVKIRRNSDVFVHIFGICDQICVTFVKNMLKLLTVVLLILYLKIEEGC